MGGEQPEDDEDMAVDVGRAGGAGGRVVWMPAPWTCGPYRLVGVSSRASVSLAAPASGETTPTRTRQAMRSARLPAAATAV